MKYVRIIKRFLSWAKFIKPMYFGLGGMIVLITTGSIYALNRNKIEKTLESAKI